MSKSTIGPDEQGRHPHQRGIDETTPMAPTHHTAPPSRGMEAQQHAILGKPGKPKGYPIAVAAGQHHVGEDGQGYTGVSRTESAAALQGDKLPTDPPVIRKRLYPAPIAWGQKSVGAEKHDATGEQARKILTDAYAVSGVDHPHNMAQRRTEHEDRQERPLQ